jgi:aspartyl-tRNA(Asn)/glutamyl-tRNA(Gln) amidotransferase subunit C
MAVDRNTVRRIAHLARIAVREEELGQIESELNGILMWIEQLGEVDTAAVEPMASVHDEALRWRADEVTDGGYPQDVVAKAPAREKTFFVVPKVIE